MALKGIDLGLVLVLVTILLCHHEAEAQSSSGCTTALVSLSPCLNYITGNSSTPSSSCCTQLASVVQQQPNCLCSVLNGGASQLGITLNQTLAMSLPGACNVQTPPVSRCNGANGPASAPAIPPSDSSDDTPDTSTTPTLPSSPSGTGSKSIADGNMSNRSSIRMPLPLTVFIVFMVSCFSGAIKA
ncbi:non-specific lipid-transfer protein-like protein At5g64080 isoform X2 [Pistacia vera]|uniref:non-specific lipid-transfer protein-like protein At5g64080 isoform X2 n=1 Tax=Pistacia vera TaxID=55513 RepID=UPI001262D950|nr:non-specific lipid-transfer protein-like protein At5g64080 isoform X2 [Pistacia vera]